MRTIIERTQSIVETTVEDVSDEAVAGLSPCSLSILKLFFAVHETKYFFFIFALLCISIITQTPPPPTPQEKEEEGEAQ